MEHDTASQTQTGQNGSVKDKGKVLVVDDMLMHLETAKLYLEKDGFSVMCASNAAGALELVSEHKPELVLLDVIIPGGDGLDLLVRIKSECPGTGVVIMTAFGSEDVAAAALKLGALEYIRKPFKYNQLSLVVEKALHKQRGINRQKQAMQNLKHAYEELQVSAESILQCISSGVVAIDNNCRIRMINQAAKSYLGVYDDDIIGKHFYEILPVLKKSEILNSAYDQENGVRFHEVTFTCHGAERTAIIKTDAIFDHNDHKIGAVVVFEDITEMRRREKKLREQDRLAIIGQMAAGMAHEIKNPLTAIKGFAQLLSTKIEDKVLIEYLQVMNREIDRMSLVIKDFLQLARPKPPEFKMMSINRVIEETLAIIEPLAFMKNIRTRVKLDGTVPESLLDAGQIKQLVLNLAQNAIEAMEKEGTISIETTYSADRNEIRLDVSDTGCGIPEDKIKDLSVPFYTTKPEGTGLGLSISYRIADQHKGRIKVKSTEGKGTVFSVLLPAGHPKNYQSEEN